MRLFSVCWAVASLLLLLQQLLFVVEQPPEPSITLPCKVVEVVDGDTITVELTVQTRVRLLDCWAPEPSDPGGPAATKNLRQHALDRDGVLHVPLGKARRFGDVMSFDRVLGHVYLDGERRSLGEIQVDAGHATKEKEK